MSKKENQIENKPNNKSIIKDIDLEGNPKEGIIFINKFALDKNTMGQINYMMRNPVIENPRFMPDCHAGGKNSLVGLTSKLGQRIIPKIIGGDIGCGITSYRCQILEKCDDWKMLNQLIINAVPTGNQNYPLDKPYGNRKTIEEIGTSSYQDAIDFAVAYKQEFGIDIKQWIPNYDWEWFLDKNKEIDSCLELDLASLGTVGGGNHFIEINQSHNNPCESFITVHSGSRNLGQKICQYHQNKISSGRIIDWKAFDDLVRKKTRKIKDSKEIKKVEDSFRKEIFENRHSEYLEGLESYYYYFDMIFAQNYARANRRLIIKKILEIVNLKYNPENIIESIHNYIDFSDLIVRKGSIPAHSDQICLVALNMRDGLLLCRGKGNPEWNYSSAHGSGRVIQRQQAQSKLSFKEFQETMKDVISSCVLKETLDESPMAYRDSELIREAIGETVEIIDHLKPIINIKGIN